MKKNLIRTITTAFVAGSMATAFAETATYTGTGDVNFSVVQAASGVAAWDNTTDVSLINSGVAEFSVLSWPSMLEIKSLTINTVGASKNTYVKLGAGNTLVIGSLTDTSRLIFSSGSVVIKSDVTLSFTGNSTCFGHNSFGRLDSFVVNGNFTTSTAGSLISAFSNDRKNDAYNFSNFDTADIAIDGVLTLKGTSTSYVSMDYNSTAITKNVYIKVGGLASTAVYNGANQRNNTQVGVLNMMITGAGGAGGTTYTNSGGFSNTRVDREGTGIKNYSYWHFIMNSSDGKLTQKLTNSNNRIGAVTVKSGTLLINYNDLSAMSHGVMTFDGGKFGNTSAVKDTNTYLFDSIVVSENGGVLIANYTGNTWNNNLVVDNITATNGISGTGTLTIDFGTSNINFLADLVANSAEEGAKIISWADGSNNTANITAVVKSFVDGGVTYEFQTFNGLDGLYVAYVAVPEASTFAAILGAFVLCFALSRRRK